MSLHSSDEQRLYSRADLAEALCVHPNRISAVLNSTPGLLPLKVVSKSRMYGPDAIPIIKRRLDELAAWARRREECRSRRFAEVAP
jgi:hypothetical protein